MTIDRPTKIPLVDLKAQYATIRDEVRAAIDAVLDDAAFIGGPYLERFEAEFAAFSGVKYVVGVSNGTDALRLALLACGIRAGNEVITVPNTFIATAEAVSMLGAKVRFVDVDPKRLTLDPARLAEACTPATKAVIPVHLYGHPAEMDPIMEIARQRGLRVIGDAAQAHGAQYRGHPIAVLGDAVCFSFYPGKNLGACGDAGAVATNDAAVAERVRMLRDHGRTRKYEHAFEGFNCRMDGLQAAVLSVKLKHLPGWNVARRRLAAEYDAALGELPGLRLPIAYADSTPVQHLYAIQVESRDDLARALASEGIQTGIHYPIPLHLQPAYSHLGAARGSFPVAERHASRTLSLPLFPEMTDDDVRRVGDAMRRSRDARVLRTA